MSWIPYPIKERIKITEMFSFFKLHCYIGYEFKGATHDFWECLYVIDGEICVTADERVYNLSKGNIIFHKPLELHKFQITDENSAIVLIFSFSAEGPLCEFFHNKVFSLNQAQINTITELMNYMQSYANLDLNSQYIDMCSPAFEKANFCSQNINIYLCQLMLSLANNNNVLSVLKSYDSRIFTKAVNYMSENVYESLSVSDISSHLNLSASSLKRIFKLYAGMGVHKYFLKLKIKVATQLLSEGYSVTYVADKLNFSSQGYFTSTFKRETGSLPSTIKT